MNNASRKELSNVDKMEIKIDVQIGRQQLFIKEWQTTWLYRACFPLNKKRNITGNKGMNKLTLRGQTKVNTQWQLYCVVHNIEKL
ncbi:transposase [Pseudoalteromonas sp. SG45-5]|nr:transposase [Pseudoalteromonas sp. SG45-5]MBB1393036.1 transposase [Pseudoalteromonas sp. SG44-4]MBB1449372.1 transposase [Pseudoalteromonas sp. SG41-6]